MDHFKSTPWLNHWTETFIISRPHTLWADLPEYRDCVYMCLVAQSCLTLCSSMDCSLPGSSSMGFSRQEYWSGLPLPSPGDLPDPEIEPHLLHCRQILYHWVTWDDMNIGMGVGKHTAEWPLVLCSPQRWPQVTTYVWDISEAPFPRTPHRWVMPYVTWVAGLASDPCSQDHLSLHKKPQLLSILFNTLCYCVLTCFSASFTQ